jgi:Ni/Co efflux regulator RcnB
LKKILMASVALSLIVASPPLRAQQPAGATTDQPGQGDQGSGDHRAWGDQGGYGDHGGGYAERPRRDRGAYRAGGAAHPRVSAEPYRYPPDVSYRFYRRGEQFPGALLIDAYLIEDVLGLGLAEPPHGDRWVRFGPDAVLVDPNSGQVLDVVYGVFDDGGYIPPPPDEGGPPPPLPPEEAGPGAATAGRADLPPRPRLEPVPPIRLPASFCSETDRNQFYDQVYKPAQAAAARNNAAAKAYLDALNALHARYVAVSLAQANAVTYEAVAYQPIARATFQTSSDYAALFDTMMALPITPCG